MSLSVALRHHVEGFDLDVAFEMGAGLTAVFGPSGAGKTTLIHAVAGLLRPKAGHVRLGERCLFDAGAGVFVPAHKRNIGYVFQEARLFPHLTVRQNLRYGGWARRRAITPDRFDEIVDLLGLDALLARVPAHLSGGEKARVAFGRAVLSSPDLLIMDEPLAALDGARKQALLPFIEGLRDTLGVPILYVSHSPAEVARLADQVLRLERGKVVAYGPTAAVFLHHHAPDESPDAGAVLPARVTEKSADGIVTFHTPVGPILLPDTGVFHLGQEMRLRLRAVDVVLARARPEGLSTLNVLAVTLRGLRPSGAICQVDLDCEGTALVAQISGRSCADMGLTVGDRVFALLKGVSVARFE